MMTAHPYHKNHTTQRRVGRSMFKNANRMGRSGARTGGFLAGAATDLGNTGKHASGFLGGSAATLSNATRKPHKFEKW